MADAAASPTAALQLSLPARGRTPYWTPRAATAAEHRCSPAAAMFAPLLPGGLRSPYGLSASPGQITAQMRGDQPGMAERLPLGVRRLPLSADLVESVNVGEAMSRGIADGIANDRYDGAKCTVCVGGRAYDLVI